MSNVKTILTKVLIKLEAGTSEQMPLIALSLSLAGELSNWLTSASLSLRVGVEVSYFNEALTAWEPVIEPVEDSNDSLHPYEVFLDMFTLKEDELASRRTVKKAAEIGKCFFLFNPIFA
jgi:hypothetical protein